MQIKEFCERSGLGRDTVRFYERQRLLEPRLRSNGYREYGQADLDRVREIQIGQLLGFTLREIRSGMELWKKGELQPEVKRALIEHKLAELREKLGELRRVEKYLVAKLKWMDGGEKGSGPNWMQRHDRAIPISSRSSGVK
jgi:DNA-binding transcriptional MerR regulator